jgi:hypothetical protein
MRPDPSATWRWACYNQWCPLRRPKRQVALGSVQSIESATVPGGARAFQAPGGARVFLSGTWRFGCHSQLGLAKTQALGALGSAPGMSIPGIRSPKCLASDRRNGRCHLGLTLTSDRPSARWSLAQPLASDRLSARWRLGLTIASDRPSARWRLGQPLHWIAQAQGGA